MKSFCFLAALAWGASVVGAESEVTRRIGLNECLQSAMSKNLDIRLQRYLPELSRLDLDSALGGYDPTLSSRIGQQFNTFEAGLDKTQFQPPSSERWNDSYQVGLDGVASTGTRYTVTGTLNRSTSQVGRLSSPFDLSDSIGINLTQPLLRNFKIDNVRWSIAIRKEEIKKSEQSIRGQIITTATDVETAYFDLIAAKENIRVQEKAMELAETSLAQNKKRVEVGAMAPLEEKQTESQVAARRADVLLAQQRYSVAQNSLKRLIEDDFGSMDHVVLEPTATLAATPYPFNKPLSWSRGIEQRPEMIQARLSLDQQNITATYRKNQMYPQLDLTAGGSLSGKDSRTGGVFEDLIHKKNPNYSYGLVFSVPLGNRAAKSDYRNAKLQAERQLLQLKQLEQRIMVEIDNAILEAKTSFERVEATKQSRIYGEAALDAEQKKLENGKSTSFFVLQLQRDLTSAQSAEIGALVDYNKAISKMSEAEGYTLERLGIQMYTK